MKRHYLLASDFDQTLSFNDSGIVLSEMLGISTFRERVAALARLNLVQQGAELAYLLAHDPEYRRVTRDDLLEVGRRVRLKRNVELLARMLAQGIDGHRFDFYVISAAPEEVVLSALDGIVPADHVVGTQFQFQPDNGQIGSLDFGGGGWASVFKDLGRTRVVGGVLLQGSESHVPASWLGDDFEYLASTLNGRGLDLDLSWGGSVGYDLTNRTVLIGKYLESDNVKSGLESDPALPDLDLRKPTSRTMIASVAYRTGALRFSGGYRFASTGAINANAIFFRANVDW